MQMKRLRGIPPLLSRKAFAAGLALTLLIAAPVLAFNLLPAQAQAQAVDPPNAPTGLTAPVETHDRVTLTWDDPGENSITGYQVLRRSRDGDEYEDGEGAAEFLAIVDDTGSAATTYTDTSVTARTRYVYRVKARNSEGLGPQSSYLNVETSAPPPPAAPTGLAVSSATHDSVALTWDDPSDSSITGYQVLRRSRDGDEYGDGEGAAEFALIADDTGSAAVTHTDSSVTARTRYAYSVKAISAAGTSGQSGHLDVETPEAPPESPLSPVRGSRPNVVLIVADDLGWGDVQSNNPDSAMTTSHIDSIGASGAIFTDAHSPSSVCSPTRYGLLTGRYGWRSWLRSGVPGGDARPMIGPGRATLGTLLQGQGYRTTAIGKWHLGMDYARLSDIDKVTEVNRGVDIDAAIVDGPLNHGFDQFFGTSANLRWEPHIYIRNNRFVANSEAARGSDSGFYEYDEVLDRLTEEAVSFIEKEGPTEAPFFLYLPLHTPHVPLAPNAQFTRLTGLGRYADVVAQMDWIVGQVLDALERVGARDNTLVIFTSDNGASMSGIPVPNHADHYSNGIWRGGKFQITEGGHRVPLLMQWPQAIEEGSAVAATVSLTDLYATLAEMAGEEPRPGVATDSVSLLPLLLGESDTRGAPIVHHSTSGMFAIRDGRWKLVFGNGHGGQYGSGIGFPFGTPWQLYDLEEDPKEKNNHVVDRPEVVARMRAAFEQIRAAEEGTLSGDATLSSLNLAGVPIRSSNARSYAASVGTDVTIIAVTAIPTATDARVVVRAHNGQEGENGRLTLQSFVEPTTTITITVTSPDKSATAHYRVTVTRSLPITGTPQVGQTLTVDTSSIDADQVAFTYQWIRNDGSADSDIVGATSATYTLTTEDQGKTILARVSFTDDRGNNETRTGAATATVGHAAGELTAAQESDILPVVSGYSAFGDLGILSPSGWEIDGTHYTVKFLVHGSESLWLGLDQQLPTDFTLHVGDSTYRGSESRVPASIEGVEGYWWPTATPDWSADEPVQVKLAIHRRVPPAERPRAPLTGDFRNIPSEHDGSGDFSFRIRFGEAVATTVDAMRDHVLAVAGGTVSSVETVGNEGMIWEVSVTPGSRDTVKIVIEADLDCDLAGAVCASDGRRLFNRMELRVPMRPNSPATGAPTIGGTTWAWVGDSLTADTSGIADADGMSGATFSYQWLFSDGSVDREIEGATQSTYKVLDADKGKTIKVQVSFADDLGYAESLTSTGMTVFVSEPRDRPYELQATAAAGAITLTWQDPNTHAPHGRYHILRHRPELGETEPLIYVRYASITDRTFVDSTVEPGVQYMYAVKAVSDPFGYLGPASDPVEVRMPPVEGANSPATGQPAISGTAQVGVTLTADASGIADEDGLDNTTFTYQWLANDSDISGATDSDIPGETGVSYVVRPGDVGRTIQVGVSFTDDQGNDETATSAATAAVSAAIPGVPRSLEVETAGTGELAATWRPPESNGGSDVTEYQVQWKLATGSWNTEADVSSATTTGTSYTITGLSLNTEYAIRVIAVNDVGDGPPSAEETETARAQTSSQQDSASNTPATGGPTITGTAAVGETLSADTSGIADENGLDNASFSYQWVRSDASIVGATGATYTVHNDDAEQSLRVQVSFTDDDGFEESLNSDAAAIPVPTSLTASFDASTVPESHDGSNTFTLEFFFNKEPSLEQAAVRDHVVTITGGEITGARQTTQDSSLRWMVTVQPEGEDDVTVTLPRTTDCDDQGAVCTAHGQMLAQDVSTTVNGPEPEQQDGQQEEEETREEGPTEPPPAPTGLTGVINGDGTITITWTGPEDDSVTGYQILRRRPEWQETELKVYVDDTGNTQTSYTDTNTVEDTRYVYRVKARNAAGLSERSNFVKIDK